MEGNGASTLSLHSGGVDSTTYASPPTKQLQMGRKQNASERFVKRLHDIPAVCGIAVLCFAAVTALICTQKLGSAEASAQYAEQVGSITWPGTVHLTSLFLSLKGYYFHANSLKKKFTLLSLYSSGVAFASYFVMSRPAQFQVVVVDAFGNSFLFYRFIQWCFTTPAMLTQIMLLADQPPSEFRNIIAADLTMFVAAIFGHVVKTKPLAIFWLAVSWAAFVVLLLRVDRMFRRAASAATILVERATRLSEDSSAEAASSKYRRDPHDQLTEEVGLEAFRDSAKVTLRMIAHAHLLTFVLWPSFGLNDMAASSGLIALAITENIWGFLDVAAKVLFSSTLSMTGLVSQDEAEKQRAWLAGQRAVAYGRSAVRRSEEVQKELKDRTETLATLCQEGWGLVVKSFMSSGDIPIVTLGTEPQPPVGLPELPEDAIPRTDSVTRGNGASAVPSAAAADLSENGYRSSSEFSRDGSSAAAAAAAAGEARRSMDHSREQLRERVSFSREREGNGNGSIHGAY